MANIYLTFFLFFIRLEFIDALEGNVAFRKPTYQTGGTPCSTSSLAVDDDPGTYTTIPSCSQTKDWWCVDLQQTVNITRIETNAIRRCYTGIKIYINVSGGCNSASKFNASLACSSNSCYSLRAYTNGQSLTARTVFVTCYHEVKLYSISIFADQCPEGYYSSSRNCVPCDCIIGICDPDTGYCLQCPTGKHGNICENNCPNCRHGCQKDNGDCNVTVCSNHTSTNNQSYVCKDGFYGDKCDEPCSERCLNGVCNVTVCSNQTLTNDQSCVCNDGFYGDKCDKPCSERCLNKTCYLGSPSLPECIEGCVDGYKGKYCDKSCPVNCIKCDRWGDNCSLCKSGWYGNKCHLSNYGCIPGKTGADCLSDCNANCTSCRQPDGNDCTSCKEGRWGRSCNNLCSPACIKPIEHQTKIIPPLFVSDICHQLTGDCIFGCTIGRKGRNCTKAYYVFTPLLTGLIGASSAVIVVFTICVIVCKLHNRRKSSDGANHYSETRKSESKSRDSYQDLSNTGYVNTSFHNLETVEHENERSNCDLENYENVPTEIVQNFNHMRGQQNQSRDQKHNKQPLYTKVAKKAGGRKPIKRLFAEKTTKPGKKAGQSKVSENRSTEQSLELYDNTHIDKQQPKCRQQIDVYVNIH